ncbi:hypothetical protein RISK_001634 [Rhodopirellula islandica]|uniref:Nucleic acid-binding protein n=1 Tax=Rhodopirellula islandica TaxID=595434 RepID=A0A0J1BJ00_RHOIS|nr:hypothetical protein RISK_001634 [Rhodopirellula islandica]
MKLLILDAGVVIKLHELGLWSAIVDRCDVHLSEIVARRECKYHEAQEDDWGRDIDLSHDIANETIKIFDVDQVDVESFKSLFDPNYFADLDAGEAESLAFLVNQKGSYRISSGDAIVYKVLGNLNRSDQGISLEEILAACGLGRTIQGYQYSKAFRLQLTQLGATDMVQGRGRKR